MTGEVGEAIHTCRHPPPFHESVMNRSEAGDLTYAKGSLQLQNMLTTANLQLRDSVGFHQLRRVLTVNYLRSDFTTELRAMLFIKPRNT